MVITDRNTNLVSRVAEKCRSLSNNKIIEVIADVTNDDDVKRLINTTIDEFGRIDILVNNAGVGKMHTFESPNLMEVYSFTMDTNVRSVVLLTSLAAPYLEQTKGTIINISSLVSLRPVSFKFLIFFK